MNEVRQTYTEGEYKKKDGQTSFKSYVVTVGNKKRWRSFFLMCGLATLILICIGNLLQERFALITLQFLVGFCITYVFFILFIKYFLVDQVIDLYEDKVIINGREIFFKDIADYQVQYYRGVWVYITLMSGEKIALVAGSISRATTGMAIFAADFDSRMKELIADNKVVIKRKKSLLESNWWLVFLIPVTCIIVGINIYACVKGMPLPWYQQLMGYAPLVAFWASFWRAKKMSKDPV